MLSHSRRRLLSNVASSRDAVGPKEEVPALFTRMSIPPPSESTARAARSRAASASMSSAATKMAAPPSAQIASTTARPLPLSRPLTTTVAPAAVRATAVALPIPLVPPVMSALLPLKSCITFPFQGRSSISRPDVSLLGRPELASPHRPIVRVGWGEGEGSREDGHGRAQRRRFLCPKRPPRPPSHQPSSRAQDRLRATERPNKDPRGRRPGAHRLPARDSDPQDGGVAPIVAGDWRRTRGRRHRSLSRSEASGTATGRYRAGRPPRTLTPPCGPHFRIPGTPVWVHPEQPALRFVCRNRSGTRRWASPYLLLSTTSPVPTPIMCRTRVQLVASSSDRNRGRTPTWR